MQQLSLPVARPARETLKPGAALFPARLAAATTLLAELPPIVQRSPFRHMQVRGGKCMSVAMTNCGAYGWVSDPRGYRYAATDPLSGQPWPPLPAAWRDAAVAAANDAGFPGFQPNACLVNRYAVGASMGLHQDRDEADFADPIVSFSFGLAALFLFGGPSRRDPAQKIRLEHGDVLVWGGPARLDFHGVKKLADGPSPLAATFGPCRINLTFRRAAA